MKRFILRAGLLGLGVIAGSQSIAQGTPTYSADIPDKITTPNSADTRNPETYLYSDRKWFAPFVGGSYEFLDGAERLLDARTMFFYYATGITPAMAMAKPGSGSGYAGTFRDVTGATLDGAKTYKITLPGPVPAKDFRSFVVYDNQTRSLLETDQKLAGVDSTRKEQKVDADDSATVYFGPTAPEGLEANWVQTMPGKGFNVLLPTRTARPRRRWKKRTQGGRRLSNLPLKSVKSDPDKDQT